MSNFWKTFFACLLAGIVLSALPFIMFMFMMVSLLSFSSKDTPVVEKESVLEINISQAINDLDIEDDYSFISSFSGSDSKTIQFAELIKTIERAKTDDNIKGIRLLSEKGFGGGLAQATALRKALLDFKESGKFIVSYATMYSQTAYLNTSLSDVVALNPNGGVELKGYTINSVFFKGFLDKYGIDIQIFKVGKYKSVVEPFTQTQMSEENRLQYLEFMNSVWDTVSGAVAENRNMTRDEINAIAAEYKGFLTEDALASGLVDTLMYQEQFDSLVKNTYGAKNKISYHKYLSANSAYEKPKADRIAVLYAQGDIMDGNDATTINDRVMRRAIEKIKKDSKVKAVVLRVDSPGGSAIISDNIWHMIRELNKTKPVVASMGNYAASGGYYISCPASWIVAEPTTLTGSIGIFGMLPNAKKLAERNGITSDEVSIFPSATYSLITPATPLLSAKIQSSIEQGYDQFISRVAEGRKMTKEQVHEVAQGRVWSGTDALEINLVDEIGGLETALAKAAEFAGVEDYDVKEYPSVPDSMERLLKLLSSSEDDEEALIRKAFGFQLAEMVKYAKRAKEGGDEILIYAGLPLGFNFIHE